MIDQFPVHTRVVCTHEGVVHSPACVSYPKVGDRGTVIGHMLGTNSGNPRLVVLFDGQTMAVQKNPRFVREVTA